MGFSRPIGVGWHFLLQRIFLTQGSNPGLLNCRQTLYHSSYREDLKKAYPLPYYLICNIKKKIGPNHRIGKLNLCWAHSCTLIILFIGWAGSSLLHRLFSSCNKWGLLSSTSAHASHCGSFSSFETWALGHVASRVAKGFSCPKACGISCHVSCIGRKILYHWATRKPHPCTLN